jgi:sterol 3beta-glucosyltransferase
MIDLYLFFSPFPDILMSPPPPPPPLSGVSRIFEMFDVPTMFVVSRSVVPQPSDWPINSNVCGWFFLNQMNYTPPADLLQFLNEDDDKPVCINFGSMVLVERTTFITDAAKAAINCGKRVLLITGWASPPEDLPKNCFCINSVPHEYIFDKCCAVIHHGGAGTVARVLEAGVPSIIVPILIGTDQPWWANRIEELKCGIHVQSQIQNTSPTSNDIEIALHRVLDENTMESKMIQESLQKVSYGMKCENGVINFVNAVTTVAENMKEKEDKKNK